VYFLIGLIWSEYWNVHVAASVHVAGSHGEKGQRPCAQIKRQGEKGGDARDLRVADNGVAWVPFVLWMRAELSSLDLERQRAVRDGVGGLKGASSR
jgi:hypothetical protein